MPQSNSRPSGAPEYWGTQEAKGGDSEFPQHNDGLDEELVQDMHGLTAHLYFLDTRIHMCREALALLQPLASGRIDIRYWKRKTLPGRHPCVFQWKVMPAGWHWNKAEQAKLRGNGGLARRGRQRVATALRLPVGGLRRRSKKKGLFAETADKVSEVLSLLDELMKARRALIENIRRIRITLRLVKTSQFRLCQKVEEALAPKLPVWKAELEARIAERRVEHDERALEHIELLAADDELIVARSVRTI
jgi:hypothetical protein